jgi:poly-gamma-glutamate synthesis protein (capsule biosynthesis protein)
MKRLWKIAIPILLAVAAILIIGYYEFPALFSPHTTVTKFSDTTDGNLQSYYQQAQSLNPRGTVATTSATFLAVGDIMLSRNVAAVIQKSNDVDMPFEMMSDVLKSTDFNFGNLESPVFPVPNVGEGLKPSPTMGIIGGHSLLFGAPVDDIKGLADFNFKILNLANNHSFDQKLAGIDATQSVLDNLNISHEGTGDNLDQAWTPAVVLANGIKICFIGASFSSINDGGKITNDYVARIEDLDNLKSAIRNSQLSCNFIVVTMHAGVEYTRLPNQAQIKFAHAAIDDGADMVIGAHPHWVQTIEKYCPLQYSPPLEGGARGGNLKNNLACPNPKYIFYSLGNFIFDQNFSQDTMEGLTLKITLSKTGCPPSPPLGEMSASGGQRGCVDDLQGSRTPAVLQSIELIPVIIKNSQPRPATTDESKNILNKINQNTNILNP